MLTGIYEFGEYRLDAQNRLLWAGKKQVSLTLKEFEVLLFLVKNAGRVITKNELLEAVWQNTFVEESTLARNISWLRKKINSDGAGENFIQTLPKRGYRFAAPVRAIEVSPAFIEEKIVTEIIIEESISLEDFAAPAVLADDSSNGVERLNLSPEKINAPKMLPAAPAARFSKSLKLLLGLLISAVFIAAAAFYLLPSAAPTVVVVKNSVPFSGLPGRENMPSFSPDGQQIAFVWNGGEGENFDVYVKQIGAGEPFKLTSTAADEVNPVFTPDGRQIAFVRRLGDHCEIFKIPLMGGAERKIADLGVDISGLSFSPDARFLAVTDLNEASRREAIFLIDVNSGEKRRLTQPPELTRDANARFSPDGKKIAFLRRFNNAYDELMLASTDSGKTVQLTFEKSDINGLSWRGDSQTIIFARRTSALISNLYQISATGGAAQIIVSSGKNTINPAISADGRRIAYVEESFETDIWKFEKNLPARRFIESALDDHSPDFSPDAARVAFVSNRTGNLEVWIADADGKNQRQITGVESSGAAKISRTVIEPKADSGSPRFSPDNKLIAYDAPVNGNSEIFTIPADGSGAARRLTFGAGRSFLPSWSADGNWIYFCSDRGGDLNLWRISSSGGGAVQLTQNGGFESFPAPDGKTIFYTKGGDQSGIWQISADGSGDHAVPELKNAAAWRYLSVTPAEIYFAAQDSPGFFSVKFYDLTSRKTSEVLRTDKMPVWTYSGMSVSFDGKTILYTNYAQSRTSIVIADF